MDEFPSLVFFENQIPSEFLSEQLGCYRRAGIYDGELEKPLEVLAWLDDLLTGADIEQVTRGGRRRGEDSLGDK